MDKLISDESAMDPEIVVPLQPSDSLPHMASLWLGAPCTWALAVFIVTGTAIFQYGGSSCAVGIILASVIACFRDGCIRVPKTGAGIWLMILHHAAGLAALASSLCSTLQTIPGGGKLHSWFTELLPFFRYNFFTGFTILFVTFLFVLGLGRSKFLRAGLMASMVTTILLVGWCCFIFKDPTQAEESLSLKEAFVSTSVFSLVFSTAIRKTDQVRRGYAEYFATFTIAGSCFLTIFFFSYIPDKESLYPGIMPFDAFQYNNQSLVNGPKAQDLWLFKYCLPIMTIQSLALSLVEVLAIIQMNVVSVAGHILSAHFAREHIWTGTQVDAILFSGLLSNALAWFHSIQDLIMLSATSFLLSHTSDLFYSTYLLYQPSYVPKNCEELEDGGQYQMLVDTSQVVQNEDSEIDLSDDSGHSSDTDIDEIVHDFKESIKVMTNVVIQPPQPTVSSAFYVTISLIIVASSSMVLSLTIVQEKAYLPLLFVLEILFFIAMIARQPQNLELYGRQFSPLLILSILSIHIAMVSSLIYRIWCSMLLWSLAGLVAWFCRRRQFSKLSDRVRNQVARVCSPLHFHMGPDHNKPPHLDHIQIMR